MISSGEKYLVIDNEDNVEYIIKVKTNKKGNNVYKLHYSKADIWNINVRGKLKFKITDNGNGMKFKLKDQKNISYLDYSDVEALRILTNFELGLSGGSNHTIVKL